MTRLLQTVGRMAPSLLSAILALSAAAAATSAQAPPPGAPGAPDGTSGAEAARPPASPLDASLLDAWRDHIRPCESERAWERIGWRTSFADGLRAAEAERKPLLLWMMNGHPLGCT